MIPDRTILVTGGAGYIGSHFVALLRERKIRCVVIDNLSRGHESLVPQDILVRGEVSDRDLVSSVCREWNVDVAVHFAAFAYVEESILNPTLYYRNNVVAGIEFLEGLRDAKVGRLVFSSSCATYGIPPLQKNISESLEQRPINPYGNSKLMFERILADYQSAYGIQSFSLRYFNAAGASDKYPLFEGHTPETHIIPRAIAAALTGSVLHINGTDYPTRDGTCERDYIHVDDLATAHLNAVELLRSGSKSDCVNLGLGKGSTLMELVNATEWVTNKKISIHFAPRRPGDPPSLVADASKAARLLNWKPRYTDLRDILSTSMLGLERYAALKSTGS